MMASMWDRMMVEMKAVKRVVKLVHMLEKMMVEKKAYMMVD